MDVNSEKESGGQKLHYSTPLLKCRLMLFPLFCTILSNSFLRSLLEISRILKPSLLQVSRFVSTRLRGWKKMENSPLISLQKPSTFSVKNSALPILFQKWTWYPPVRRRAKDRLQFPTFPLEQWRYSL